MNLNLFAERLLFGETLADKLAPMPVVDGLTPSPSLLRKAPRFPGRPESLRRFGRGVFPDSSDLSDPGHRGRLLHFFANHELLALELMALVLLRFPDAPSSFRQGLACTAVEEQGHLKLYLERMAELGVEFGELPVSDYFWNAIKDTQSPLEFVTQMSLTLEQANLDYARHYRDLMQQMGDEKTANLLDRVYREEIGHVRHGLQWFRRWYDRQKYQSEWDAYVDLLPVPMSPRRAKGPVFYEEPRRLAGLESNFIRQLDVFAGSKGRPPVIWFFNALCDSEIARGKPGFTPSAPVRQLQTDLQTLPLFLAKETDVVLVTRLPSAEWLLDLKRSGFASPEFRLAQDPTALREPKMGGFEPWGWSPDTFQLFQSHRSKLVRLAGTNSVWCRSALNRNRFAETDLGRLYSKAWSTRYLSDWLSRNPQHRFGSEVRAGKVFSDWRGVLEYAGIELERGQSLLVKAPWATSGAGNKRILELGELDGPRGGWIRNVLSSQGEIVVEPLLHKVADFSLQMEIGAAVRIKGIRRFLTGSQFEYLGTDLDPKFRCLPASALRALQSDPGWLKSWAEFAGELGAHLRGLGYQGPAGLDAMLYEENGHLVFKPLIELNPRWTLGRVALELEKHVVPGLPAHFRIMPLRKAHEYQAAYSPKQVLKKRGTFLGDGVHFLTEPRPDSQSVALLMVGNAALGLEG